MFEIQTEGIVFLHLAVGAYVSMTKAQTGYVGGKWEL